MALWKHTRLCLGLIALAGFHRAVAGDDATQPPKPPATADSPEKPNDLSNYLEQMVCQKPGSFPGNPECGKMRRLSPDEDPGYRLSNGAEDASFAEIINIPVIEKTSRRVITVLSRPKAPKKENQAVLSIFAEDTDMISLLGTKTPGKTTRFAGPYCSETSSGSRRMFNAWILGPLQISPDPKKNSGSGQTRTGSMDDANGPCPGDMKTTAYTWIKRPYRYASGDTHESLISTHYDSAGIDGGVGKATHKWRIYLAEGMGPIRSEEWIRSNWSDKKTGMNALMLGAAAYKNNTCNLPARDATAANGMNYDLPAEAVGMVSEIGTLPSGREDVWIMTRCQDYSRIEYKPAAPMMKLIKEANEDFWE